MKSLFAFLVVVIVLSLNNQIIAQENDDDINYYLDDGGLSNAKNVLKVNLSNVIFGELPIYYERAIFDFLSIEMGAGILLPYHVPDISDIATDDYKIVNPEGGYSFWIQPKIYGNASVLDGVYMGFQYRQRNFTQDSLSIRYDDYAISYGFQIVFAKYMTFDYSAGVGFRFEKDYENDEYSIVGLAMPINLCLGIIF